MNRPLFYTFPFLCYTGDIAAIPDGRPAGEPGKAENDSNRKLM